MKNPISIEGWIVIAIGGILAAIAVIVLNAKNNPDEADSMTLKASDWQCLKAEERDYTQMVLVGKVWVQKPGRRMECIELRRRAWPWS